MKIAQIAPNWTEFHADEAIGIKAVIRDLSRGLVSHGHDVTLFVPDKSTCAGVSIRFSGPSLADQGSSLMGACAPLLQREYAKRIIKELSGFDVVHSHIEHDLLPFVKEIKLPVVSTIHGASFQDMQVNIYKEYPFGTFIALSQRAKLALPYIHFSGVVYNGIDIASCPFVATPVESPYVAWMGRFTENKGVLDAITAAKSAAIVITLVGFEEKGHDGYFQKVKVLEDGANVRLLDGMIGHVKYAFLGNARAFLFPIHWEEPFGLVMVEAMACGTPVIAYNRGSVSEIVKDGVTGFIIDQDDTVRPAMRQGPGGQAGKWIIKKKGIEGLVEAIKRIGEIDRASCRKHVEEKFTIEKMVEGYENVYKKVLGKT